MADRLLRRQRTGLGRSGDDPKARYALAYGTLKMTTDVPAKRAFLKQLRDKYRNQAGLSKAWALICQRGN